MKVTPAVSKVLPLHKGLGVSGATDPLPMRDGIRPSRVWLEAGPWATMGEFLLQRFPYLQADVLQQRIQRGDIVNGQGEPQWMHSVYQPEQWLWYYREVACEVPVPFDMPVVYADERIIAVDKPHFLATIPTGSYLKETALVRVRAAFNNGDITPLHRLDRDTAGILLFCVQPRYRGVYQQLFQGREVRKVYEAVAAANVAYAFPCSRRSHITSVGKGEFMMHELADEAANSETYIEQLQRWPDPRTGQVLAHYRLHPTTGRKHQLRVHMAALGCPILHDHFYPRWDKSRAADDFRFPLQLLARSIAFTDPVDGQAKQFSSQRQLQAVPVAGNLT